MKAKVSTCLQNIGAFDILQTIERSGTQYFGKCFPSFQEIGAFKMGLHDSLQYKGQESSVSLQIIKYFVAINFTCDVLFAILYTNYLKFNLKL